jgi:hypothetical protein
MTDFINREKANRYILERLSALPACSPDDGEFLISLDELRLLKEGAADPSYALVCTVRALVAEHVPEGEIEKNLVRPFRKTRHDKEA